MKIKRNKKTSDRVVSRLVKKARVRNKISGSAERPRVCIFRSNSHVYLQVVDDVKSVTLLSESTISLGLKGNKESAKAVGASLGKKLFEMNILNIVFDRGGYRYHGQVSSAADGVREAGIIF